MPYGRRGRRSATTRSRYRRPARRAYRARYRARTRRTRRAKRTRWEIPIRPRKFVKIAYADTGYTAVLGSSGGYINSYVFRGNGAYDPDYAGIGVQPYAWDQLCPGLFNHYRVAASSIRMHINVPQAATDVKIFVVPWRNTAAQYTDAADLRQMPRCKQIVVNGQLGTMRGHNLSHYCSTRAIFPELPRNDDTLSSSYNNVPYSQWYWLIYFDTTSQVQTTTIVFDIEIKYYTVLEMTESVNES